MSDDTIKINTGEIKKVINNKYTFLFSLLLGINILLLIFKAYNLGSGFAFLAKLFAAFSAQLLIFLAISLFERWGKLRPSSQKCEDTAYKDRILLDQVGTFCRTPFRTSYMISRNSSFARTGYPWP